MPAYPIGLARASLARSRLLVAAGYALAAAAGWLGWHLVPAGHPVAAALSADLAATLVVFAASTVVCNASVYDPYWSVAPPVVLAGWLLTAPGGVPARQILVLVLVTAWAVRLTANWVSGWRGLGHEDWRYRELRERAQGRLPWWTVNLVGIQLMPTLVVFTGLLSGWPALTGTRPVGPLDAVAATVTGGAVLLEASADRQLRRFTSNPANQGRTADTGLWRRSRHPNYLGEIGFWWGLWLFGLAAAPGWWWTVVGPLTMVALFVGVSIPLMDRRSLARRAAYAQHMRAVPALLPRPRLRIR